MILLKFILFFAAATVAAALYKQVIFTISYIFMNLLNLGLTVFGFGSLL
jgi:hypothetical protein